MQQEVLVYNTLNTTEFARFAEEMIYILQLVILLFNTYWARDKLSKRFQETLTYRVSAKIRPALKIRTCENFQNCFNISTAFRISPS